MIKVAFLEYEKYTKEIAFQLSKIFMEVEWTFRHYLKASDLKKACDHEDYTLFVFDEMFKTQRVESVFVHDNPNALFIYVCEDIRAVKKDDQRSRVLYISKENVVEDLLEIQDKILSQCSQVDIYEFNYDGTHVNLPYEDIYYMEKVDKMVYFYTKKGEFHKRVNMSDLETQFENYGFVRTHVSYLVNEKRIVAWYKDEVEIMGGTKIPMSRAQKRKILGRD